MPQNWQKTMTEQTNKYLLKDTVLSTELSRRVDKVAIENYQMHSLVLMENAALNSAQWIANQREPSTALILCGRGNNGGDGLAIARHLDVFGWQVSCLVLGPIDQLSADCRANFDVQQLSGAAIDLVSGTGQATLPKSDLIIDAMLGTGVTGSPREPFATWIQQANDSSAWRVAIDIPTGIDPETGQAFDPAFAADATITFVAKKPAMVEKTAERLFGEIVVQPIGIPSDLLKKILTWS